MNEKISFFPKNILKSLTKGFKFEGKSKISTSLFGSDRSPRRGDISLENIYKPAVHGGI